MSDLFSAPPGLRWMDFHVAGRKWTVGERKQGYPKDLNILVCQRFFRCLDCEGLFESSIGGAHIQRRCYDCRRVFDRARNQAMGAVHRAIKRGELEPANKHKCVDCSSRASVWEHRSYDAKLDVVPTCRSCNVKRGSATHTIPQPAAHPGPASTNPQSPPDETPVGPRP